MATLHKLCTTPCRDFVLSVIVIRCWLILLLVVSVAAPRAHALEKGELCPLADDRLHRSAPGEPSGEILRAPQTEQEIAKVLGAIYTGKKTIRKNAIVQAALQGNLRAFRYLVEIKDWDGLYLYADHYLNEDGTVCIAPRIERTLRRQMQRREAGRRLVAVLRQNTYQRPRTFAALTAVPFDSMEAYQWVEFARAITATHIPGIEVDILGFARELMPFETAAQNRVLPGLHRHYVSYFAQRGYRPAVGYFKALLGAARRSEPLQSFQIEYSKLRATVHDALATVGSPAAQRALVAELDDISLRALDAFAAAELITLSAHAARFTGRGVVDDVVSAYARILSHAQIDRYDYSMRQTLYPALGAIRTPSSAALLVAQLQGYLTDTPPPNRDASVSLLFQALDNFAELDVEPLIDGVGYLRSPVERHAMWRLVGRHPSDRGVSFLLQQLSFGLRGGPQAAELMGPQASAWLLDVLTRLPGVRYQRYARDGVDSLFDQGLLDAVMYEAAAAKYAVSLGDRSDRYLAYLQRQALLRVEKQENERLAVAQSSRRALQGTFEDEVKRQSTADAIARNVAVLTSGSTQSQSALRWLVVVGELALPALHAALAAADTTDPQKLQLLAAISEIGSTTSVGPILQMARSRADGLLYRPAFQALALIDPTPRSIDFAREQLGGAVAPAWRAAALVYLGQIRYEPATANMETYAGPNTPPRVRVAAFYLGARLGLPGVVQHVEAALVRTTDPAERDALLEALGEGAVSVREFERVAAVAGIADNLASYQQALAYCAFRTTGTDAKIEQAYKLLTAGAPNHRREAIRYLVANDRERLVRNVTGGAGSVMPLHMLLPQSNAVQMLFSEGRRMGYALEHTGRAYVLRKM